MADQASRLRRFGIRITISKHMYKCTKWRGRVLLCVVHRSQPASYPDFLSFLSHGVIENHLLARRDADGGRHVDGLPGRGAARSGRSSRGAGHSGGDALGRAGGGGVGRRGNSGGTGRDGLNAVRSAGGAGLGRPGPGRDGNDDRRRAGGAGRNAARARRSGDATGARRSRDTAGAGGLAARARRSGDAAGARRSRDTARAGGSRDAARAGRTRGAGARGGNGGNAGGRAGGRGGGDKRRGNRSRADWNTGAGKAHRGSRRTGSRAGQSAAGNPLDDDGDASRGELDASAAAEDGDDLGTSLEGDVEEALTTDEDGENTTETAAEDSTNGSLDEANKITNEASVEADRYIGRDGEGKPEENNGLELGAEVAAGAGEPDGDGGAELNAEGRSMLALGAGLKDGLDISFEVNGEVRVEECNERSLSALDEDTGLLDERDEGGTDGNGLQGALRQVAKSDNLSSDPALQPGHDGGFQVSIETAVRAAEPDLEGSLDIGLQAGNNTTSSAQAERSLDIGTEMNSSAEEGLEGRLGANVEDGHGLKLSSLEDTVDSNEEIGLGGNFGASGEENRQSGADIDRQGRRGARITPVQEVCLQMSINVSSAVEPGLELHESMGIDVTSGAAQRTGLKGSGRVSTEAVEHRRRTVPVTKKITEEHAQVETTMDTANVDISTDIEIEGTVLQRGTGEPEGVTRQTGEQKNVRSHCAESPKNVSECLLKE